MYFSSSIATQTFISEGVLVAKCFMPSFVLGSVQVCKLAQAIMFLHWDVKSAFLMAELYLLAERVFNETLTSAPTLLLASPLSPPAIFSLHQTMTFHGLMFLQRFSFFVMLPLSTFFSSFVCVNLNIYVAIPFIFYELRCCIVLLQVLAGWIPKGWTEVEESRTWRENRTVDTFSQLCQIMFWLVRIKQDILSPTSLIWLRFIIESQRKMWVCNDQC